MVHTVYEYVRYLVLTVVTVNITVFWDVAPCIVVETNLVEEPAASCFPKVEAVHFSRMLVNS
jgi:hypothetical protein